MKTKLTLTSLLIGVSTLIVFGIGPKIPRYLTFTPSPSTDVTGYWFYWRAQVGGVYSDMARLAVSTNGQGTDLYVLGLPRGKYLCTMTATNAAGAESDPAPDYLWDYTNPNSPKDLLITK